MGRKQWLLFTIVISCLVLVAGCVPGDGTNTSSHPAGFFWGIWHGWLAPLSILIGLFKHSIRVYEVHNSGWWYDIGFYIAVISGFGGISLSRRRKRTSNE